MKLARTRRLGLRTLALGSVLVLLAGCASSPPASLDASDGRWSGRLALRVQDTASQSFSAEFDLRGNARAGDLTLFGPLGTTVALLNWSPGAAMLRSNGQVQQFDSVEALLTQATGAAIPVAALFDWLSGQATPVAGWRPDLSELSQGRLAARREQPPPQADLRIVLDPATRTTP